VTPTRVAIIVGPVGSLTPTYLALADAAAAAAEQHGAVVARAYSPYATPGNVLAAVADANVIIYFGHGYGHPSPYGGLNTAKQNGWALQGPRARGTHGDAAGEIAYYGEDWIVANARPAPGFVMIYSNTCYAPGASEGGDHAPATPSVAAQRVAFYSRSTFSMGGSAYFATDFDRGAADLVARLLGHREAPFGTAFVSDPRYVPSALTTQPHHFSVGQQIWLHRSKYTDGPPNYWYAFAGNPDLSPLRAWDRIAPTATLVTPEADAAPGAVVQLQLSEDVSGVSASTVSVRDVSGNVVDAEVTYDDREHMVEVRPSSPLGLSARYAVALAEGIRDAAGLPLEPASWSFSTRIDADPLTSLLPIVLEAGTHELVQFAADGSVSESRIVEVGVRYWLSADLRARPLAQSGSWLRIADPAHAGWWVAESGRAHALGQVEEAILSPPVPVTLPAAAHAVHGFGPVGPQSIGLAISGSSEVTVDRRRVFDGRTYVRLSDTEYAGTWLEVDSGVSPTEGAAQRLLLTEARSTTVTLALDPGERLVFQLDGLGRVVDRRTLGADDLEFASDQALVVGAARFAVIAHGDLAGWALVEDSGVRVLNGTVATPLD
jgi:hypothetical protein